MLLDLALPLLILAIVVVILLLAGMSIRTVTIQDFQSGLLVHNGVVIRDLGPGRYRAWNLRTEIVPYDRRERVLTVAGQEILTSDQLPVRVSVLVNQRIVDTRLYRSKQADPEVRVYGEVQVECRARVSSRTLDQLLSERTAMTEGFAEKLNAVTLPLGVEVTGVELRDITLAGPAKQAYAEVWKAQKEGLAALERARGEHASLRSLANAARILKGNPELMNLRLLQALSGGPGKPAPTVVLGSQGMLPVSRETGDLPVPEDQGP
jgi:regulator of protease activity HflC (stomatin/prohibitin superfamily)